MNRYAGCWLLVLILCILTSDLRAGPDGKSLSRRRRYVVFPEGSTFSIALCMTMHTLTPDNIFTEGVNWGISYDLPNESKPILEPFLQLKKDQMKPANKYGSYGSNQLDKNAVAYPGWSSYDKYHFKSGKRKYYKPDYYYLQRRHRRDLYSKLETVMNAMNFDGRSCVLRALCEASQRLMPKGNTLVEEMMRISFSFPLKRLFSSEPKEHRTYGSAHKAGHQGQDCASMFAGCSFSLIDMALGKYDAARTREQRFPPGYAAATDAMLRRVMVCYLAWLSSVSGIKNITGGVSRHLRSIGFPEGSGMGIFFALGVPVDIPNKSVIFSLYFEANYALPNSSYYWDEPYLWKRSLDRQLAYRVFVNKLESVGYSGEDCLLKMICETANEPLSNNGVLGDILQILFTPSSSQDEDLPSDVVEAEYAEDCDNYHRNCPRSPLALISRYDLKGSS